MDRSVGSPRTRSVVGVRGPGVSVFGLPILKAQYVVLNIFNLVGNETEKELSELTFFHLVQPLQAEFVQNHI